MNFSNIELNQKHKLIESKEKNQELNHKNAKLKIQIDIDCKKI